MGDTFVLPFKLAVIFEALKQAGEVFNGIDSGSRDHDVVAAHFKRLSDLLIEELGKLPTE
jgi:hypothetical protein